MIGIYAIVNKKNGKKYVGMSTNIFYRAQQHFAALRCGFHSAKKLQIDYNESNSEDFLIDILETCKATELKKKEKDWMKKLDSIENGYNPNQNSSKEADYCFKDFDPLYKEKLIKKAFARAHNFVINRVNFNYLSEEDLNKMLPVFNDNIEHLRSEHEILVIPDSFEKYRKVPFVFLQRDLELI